MKQKERLKKQNRFRLFVQVLFTALMNGYAIGFVKGKIFSGDTKLLCVPGLNCYSCPGALGSCPIGALQAVLGGHRHNFSFYVIGTMMIFGVVLGRFICGFLCPFGLIQDLLHKIPVRKIKVPKKIDKPLRVLKYIILVVMVIALPILLTDEFGLAPPYFCKWLCPVGTLEGAFPLLIKNESLRQMLGFLFDWKVAVLVIVVLLSTMIYRPFCKYLCPLGGFYGLFNRFSLYRMQIDREKCTDCKACEKLCPMQVEVLKNINSTECIRCGKCAADCPTQAIEKGFGCKPTEETSQLQ